MPELHDQLRGVRVPISSARYWLGTCFCDLAPTELPEQCNWIKGQREKCPTTGRFFFLNVRLHWQLFIAFAKQQRLSAVKRKFCNCHWEPSKSQAAERYVWKEDTRVDGTQFEIGQRALKRNSEADWEIVRSKAKAGNLDEIPADIYVR